MRRIAAFCMVLTLLTSACTPSDRQTDSAPEADSNPAAGSGPGLLTPDADATTRANLPAPAPAVSVTTLDGEAFSLADRQGEVILVNFWATWCGPCVVEIPDLQELYDEYADAGLTVVGISVEEGDDDLVRAFVEEFKMTYPVAISMEMADAFGGVYGLPTTFVVDRKGQVVERIIGLFPTEEMLPRLQELLFDEV